MNKAPVGTEYALSTQNLLQKGENFPSCRTLFAVITTEPDELPGHDRMPVIIMLQDYQRWLAPSSEEQRPVDLIHPFDTNKMKAWRVDRRVNNVWNNEPALCKPIEEDTPEPEKPKRSKEAKRKPQEDETGQIEMFLELKLLQASVFVQLLKLS